MRALIDQITSVIAKYYPEADLSHVTRIVHQLKGQDQRRLDLGEMDLDDLLMFQDRQAEAWLQEVRKLQGRPEEVQARIALLYYQGAEELFSRPKEHQGEGRVVDQEVLAECVRIAEELSLADGSAWIRDKRDFAIFCSALSKHTKFEKRALVPALKEHYKIEASDSYLRSNGWKSDPIFSEKVKKSILRSILPYPAT